MRDRLIELLSQADFDYDEECNICVEDGYPIPLLEEFFADYLLKNGAICLPCKAGDTVYPLYADRRFKAFIEKIEINANGTLFYWVQYDVGVDCTECWDEDIFTIDDIGKTVFLDEIKYLIALRGEGE